MSEIPARSPGARAARAQLILDVAADLLVRWGYNRVTIDDIARHAEIGKGTVYLHWRTREQLFAAVLEREVQGAVGDVVAELGRDPQTVLPHRFLRTYFVAIMGRPILRAFFRADTETLGKLSRALEEGGPGERHRAFLRAYLELLAQHGLLRDDLTTEALGVALLATLEGFILSVPTDGATAMDLNAWSELLAQTIRPAFEAGGAGGAGASPPVAQLAARTVELLSGLDP